MAVIVEKKKKRKKPLSRDEVLLRALEMADADGIEAITMRNLARSLGVEAMSLYNHVKNKEDLFDGLVEIVASEIEVPSPEDDWRDAMRKRATSHHEALLRHTWAAPLMVSRMNVGPVMLRLVDATIGCLREAGFTWAMADHAWNAIDSHVYGFTLLELNFPLAPGEYAETAARFLPMIPADTHPYMHAMSVEVIEGRHDGLNDFMLGLDLLLDGFERLREQGQGT